jgi:hypothetical protein
LKKVIKDGNPEGGRGGWSHLFEGWEGEKWTVAKQYSDGKKQNLSRRNILPVSSAGREEKNSDVLKRAGWL